jgi:hypothetical protein
LKLSKKTITFFEFGGQFKILGPGVHLIKEPMIFKGNVRLDSFYIEIGPEKWVTVPEGYDGISVNRGSIRVLEGGRQHHLTHVGDMFSKMVPKTLQSDRIASDVPGYVNKQSLGDQIRTADYNDQTEYLHTVTADGSAVILDSMIFWFIVDTELAAKTAMKILDIGA